MQNNDGKPPQDAPPVITPPPIIPKSPPPLPKSPPSVPKQQPRRMGWGVRIVIFTVVAVIGFAGFRAIQFAAYMRNHPSKIQPGEKEFEAANRLIISDKGSQVFGNSQEAINLAKDYSKTLKLLRDNFYEKGGKTALFKMEGDFLTYCQLNEDSCVFLVHVPELRKFTGDAKKSLADLAWLNAQVLLQARKRPKPKTVVVGVKGLMLYESIMIGDLVANPKQDNLGIKTRGGSRLRDMNLFYPYFIPESTSTNLISTSKSSSSPESSNSTKEIKSAPDNSTK